MKKRDPLSRPETMRPSASPRLKPSSPGCPGGGFAAGLMDRVSGFFNVSAVDTFIEEPCSVLALGSFTSNRGTHKSRLACCQVGRRDQHARVRFGDKPRLGLLFSFSVEGLA